MITISNGNLTATINPKGAELNSLKSINREYIWDGNPEFWGKHSPILFPIVGTLKNNSYHYNDKEYHLSRHGFARDLDFIVIEKNKKNIVFLLNSTPETLENYPFDFELQVRYTLQEKSLNIAYTVINKGKNAMPFSIGAHPAFALPENFENYSISFEKDEALNYFLLENDLISDQTKNIAFTDKQIPLTYELFKNDALIFKTISSKSVIILEAENPILRVNFQEFPSLGLWTKINAPFLCIEPWLGFSDVLDSNGNLFEKEGIHVLAPNEDFLTQYSIAIL